MTKFKFFLFSFFVVGFSYTISAQYITVDESLTADQLVRDILINNPCVSISNVSASGIPSGTSNSYARFTDGGSTFPFAEGVILSTGKAASAVGPNSFILSEGGGLGWLGDPDLEQALNVGDSNNATVLEFDFLPTASKISFDYIFSSEQYLSNPNPNQCNFTDGFVFLLRKANTTDPYQNLAVIPGTTTPIKINTVRGASNNNNCPAANAQFFGGFNGQEHPTNFNGQTVLLTATSDVVPGTLYHIKLVVADQGPNGNFQYDSAIFLGANSFKIEKDLGDDRTLALGNPLCVGETLVLNATEPGVGNTYQWFKDNVLQPETTELFTVSQPGTYRVEITVSGTACKIAGDIEVEYNSFTLTPATIVQCDPDNDGITTFNLKLADGQVAVGMGPVSPAYYENQSDLQPIINPESYSSVAKTVFAKITNSFGCAAFAPVNLQITNNVVAPLAPVEICDDDAVKDGIFSFDLNADVTPIILQGLPAGLIVQYYLNENDALKGINQLSSPFENTTASAQTIYAKITNGPECYDIIEVPLVVNVFTIIGLSDESVPLCEGSFVNVSVPNGYSYSWNDVANSTTNAIRVSTPGTYSVKITDANNCSLVKNFTVLQSSVATNITVDVKDFQGDANSVIINFTGSGNYEFSIDGKNYQTSPEFNNVKSGFYTVYINELSCGPATSEFFVMDYPKFFSPNGDGFNDVWRIPFLSQYPKSTVRVFNRYGKLVNAFSGKGFGWDGQLNGQPLPASDYWFVIMLEDGRTIKGHFALKR